MEVSDWQLPPGDIGLGAAQEELEGSVSPCWTPSPISLPAQLPPSTGWIFKHKQPLRAAGQQENRDH